jgi:hypothetical protein
MNDSHPSINEGTTLKMSLQRLSDAFLSMSSFSQAGILSSTAIVLIALSFFLFRARVPTKSNKSKAERAKEMKHAFQAIEKHQGISGGTVSIKVGVPSLNLMVLIH